MSEQTWLLGEQRFLADVMVLPKVRGRVVGDREKAFAALYQMACTEAEMETKGKRGWTMLREGDALYVYCYSGETMRAQYRYTLIEMVHQVRTDTVPYELRFTNEVDPA